MSHDVTLQYHLCHYMCRNRSVAAQIKTSVSTSLSFRGRNVLGIGKNWKHKDANFGDYTTNLNMKAEIMVNTYNMDSICQSL